MPCGNKRLLLRLHRGDFRLTLGERRVHHGLPQTVRLLIADVKDENGHPELIDIVREMRVVRLGQGVDATGWLAEAALDRTFAAVEEYARLIKKHKVDKIRFVATSATRDAAHSRVRPLPPWSCPLP